jgi:hypothetical protein
MGLPQPAVPRQEQLHDFLRNFPVPILAGLMRVLIFPRGRTSSRPMTASVPSLRR